MAFVRAIVLAYEKYGVDPSNALRQAQITPAQLRRNEARITAAQMETVSGAAMQELDDEALGWFSRKLPWGSYGMLCRASITSPDLGVAIRRWCRHHRLLTDDIGLELSVSGDVAHYRIEEHRKLGAFREFCLVTSLRFLHGFACWAIDSRIPLREASFPFAAPAHAEVYPLLFPGQVYFNATQAGFSFDAQYLAMPLRRDEAALRAMLQRALPLTVLQYRRDRLLVQRVRELLLHRGAELSTADALARELNISTRTLHRQLLDEGASLQDLKDHTRRDLAIDLLTRGSKSVKQIAHAAGFGNEKSFARAFKAWTGQSPSDYRGRSMR
ncbi:AraC family transcriptional regulator [Albitalea terrae]|uniref:AraC family transcriptional regulator n=2 Tax=Piscinibacter terrae TaxID=2496871 RepID=A0A3N7JX06_9BURK|nr:AraC family transcriptional regulator [Albitalea terrae]